MKVMTVLGTRPEIIRLNLIIKKLDKYCEHVFVHTGQNFTDSLNSVFFDDFQLRKPDYFLGVRGTTFGEQIGKILIETDKVIQKEKPDKLLILGDTNSALASIIAKRMGIPVYHMEAGNRCFDDRVPEEVNRRIIDHSSDVLLPYTHRSKENLLREGIPIEKIYVTGNPIYEVLESYREKIDNSKVLNHLNIDDNKYFLVTAHRAENVDDPVRLKNILQSLKSISEKYHYPLICSLHPRTKNMIEKHHMDNFSSSIMFIEPVGFFDFVKMEKNALCIITDSGTVQEECCIFKKPNVTIRDVTERPETIECGSNMIAGVSPETVLKSVDIALGSSNDWKPPEEYLEKDVSSKIVKILLGYT
jgi:UDP-N-acetylglucosamine 2-epimerase (non-hydrolysing)